MSGRGCPELEVLFTELSEGGGPAVDHARDCPDCAALLEEHRELEKELFRLSDPLPPRDFVTQVMAKVEAAPAPARQELAVALSILGCTGALLVALAVVGHLNAGTVGIMAATSLLKLRLAYYGVSSGLEMVWRTAAIPLTAALTVVLMLALVGLRRVAGAAGSGRRAEASS